MFIYFSNYKILKNDFFPFTHAKKLEYLNLVSIGKLSKSSLLFYFIYDRIMLIKAGSKPIIATDMYITSLWLWKQTRQSNIFFEIVYSSFAPQMNWVKDCLKVIIEWSKITHPRENL